MSLAVVRSRAPASGRAPEVTVEVHLANGLPSFSIVGLPDLEVRESRERVRAALQNCGFEFPVRRITVNLAPADLPKESGRFDLPIALGILAASSQIPAGALGEREFAGELSLTGALRPMRGAFAMACGTARSRRGAARPLAGSRTQAQDDAAADVSLRESDAPLDPPELYLPAASAGEAALVPGVAVFGAADLPSLCEHLCGEKEAGLAPIAPPALERTAADAMPPDMTDVIGQHGARRALEVGAAGGHHVLPVASRAFWHRFALDLSSGRKADSRSLWHRRVLKKAARRRLLPAQAKAPATAMWHGQAPQQSMLASQKVHIRSDSQHTEGVDACQHGQRIGPFVHVRRPAIVRWPIAERLGEIDRIEGGDPPHQYQ